MGRWIVTSGRTVGLAAFLALFALASGCSSLNVQKPTASLRSANVADVTQEGLTVNFDVDVDNPNAVAIPLSAADYKLSLGGVRVVDDRVKPKGSIPANGSLPVTVPVTLSFQDLLSAQQAIARGGGDVPYDFDGALEFSPGGLPFGGPLRVPLRASGTLNMRRALEEAFQNPRILTNPDARQFLQTVLGRGILGDLLGR
jgi:LEA14-like dessication related protein